MPSVTWTHAGSPHTTINLAFSGTLTPANWVTAINTWIATTNENGDSGTVLCATAPSAAGLFMDLQNDGSIPPTATLLTIQMQFAWALTNGPMGGGSADSVISTSIAMAPISSGPGASSGSYNQTNDITTVIGSNVPADLFTAGPIGWVYSPTNTGVFAAHNRRISVTAFSITVAYSVPTPTATVTRVTPASGTVNGGQAITITGVGFASASGATFGGVSVTAFHIVNDTTITAVTPEHVSGVVDVTVTGVATLTGGYTYLVVPPVKLPPLPSRTPVRQGGGRGR